MAEKRKRPAYDLKAAGRRRDIAVRIAITAAVVIFAVVLIGYIVISHEKKTEGGGHAQAVRVTSSKLVTKNGNAAEPKAVVAFYEDFLCPACGNFERNFGPTVSKLIDSGAIAADYYMVGILSSPRNDDYSSRAGGAGYCVADDSMDAFRRFHTALFTKQLQPSETGTTFPDDARLIEVARQAGVVGKVPDCIKSGKYVPLVDGLAAATGIHATPTIKINGEEYTPSTPDALVAKIKEIVGDVPGIDTAATPAS